MVICLVFKRVTDDEAFSLRLYLQKLSREWSLLNNITWSRVGAAAADATFGGYLIITAALFIGRITGELPTHRRVTELVLLGTGSILFIAMGQYFVYRISKIDLEEKQINSITLALGTQ